MLRPACSLPPKRLLTPRSARHLSTTNRGLLPGAPVPTRTGLSPVSLDQLAGHTMAPRYERRAAATIRETPHSDLRFTPTDDAAYSDEGERPAQRVEAHGAQAECLGVEVLEAEGCAGPCHGILPGLQPGPLAELAGGCLARQAEAAA